MKHKKGRGRSSDIESSEDERIIDDPLNDFIMEGDEGGNDDEDGIFDNSQELTQVVPGRVKKEKSPTPTTTTSHKKKKKKSKTKELTPPPSRSATAAATRPVNGYRVREVDVTEIPDHLLANLKEAEPCEADFGVLRSKDVQEAATSNTGGIWILQCPKNVSLGELLIGKKLSLDGGTYLFNASDDENDANLTQYAPSNALGVNITDRKFEALSVASEAYKEGVALLLPENNRYNMVAAPVHGHIIIRESIQELSVPKIKIPKTKPRTLPTGIKERHPVYGADFSKIIQQMESHTKLSKKKKRRQEADETLLPVATHHVKLNGFHSNLDATTDSKVKDDESDDHHQRKKKKKKKCREDIESTNCTDAPNQSMYTASCDDTNYEEVHRKKKSKKTKRDADEEPPNCLEDTLPIIKKSKKSKHHV